MSRFALFLWPNKEKGCYVPVKCLQLVLQKQSWLANIVCCYLHRNTWNPVWYYPFQFLKFSFQAYFTMEACWGYHIIVILFCHLFRVKFNSKLPISFGALNDGVRMNQNKIGFWSFNIMLNFEKKKEKRENLFFFFEIFNWHLFLCSYSLFFSLIQALSGLTNFHSSENFLIEF